MRVKLSALVPVAGLMTVGLLVAAPAAQAAPAPQGAVAAASVQHLPNAKHGPYKSSQACHAAGKKGQSQGKWHHYVCKQEHQQWYLYTS
jgi:hypothetical protein